MYKKDQNDRERRGQAERTQEVYVQQDVEANGRGRAILKRDRMKLNIYFNESKADD